MMILYRDPPGEDIFTEHTGPQTEVADVTVHLERNGDSQTLQMDTRIRELENLLRENRVRQRIILSYHAQYCVYITVR